MSSTPKTKKTHGQRKALKVGIVSGVLFLASLITCVLSGVNSPSPDNVASSVAGKAYYGLTNYEDGSYAYGDEKGNVYTYTEKNQLRHTVNLKDEIGKITTLDDTYKDCRLDHLFPEYDEDGKMTSTVWGTAITTADPEKNYLFKFDRATDNKLSLNQYYTCMTSVDYVTYDDTTVYFCTWDNANRLIIKKLPKNNLGDKIQNAYVYNAVFEDDYVDFYYRLKARVFALAAIDNYVYVLHQSGISKIDKSFKYNKPLTTMKDTFKDNATYFKDETNVEHIHFDYGDEGETITKYYADLPGAEDYSGGAYDPLGERFIIPTINSKIISILPSSLDEIITGNTIPESKITKLGIEFGGKFRSKDLHNALTYDVKKKKGIVEFQDSATLALVDFTNNKVEQTFDAYFDITEMRINDKSGELFYIYTIVSDTGKSFYFEKCDMAKMATAGLNKVLFIVTLVLSIVSAIVCSVSFVGFFARNRMNKIIETGKNMKKHWLVYAIMIPSLILLCMFCYYPAIGSINLSFYNYTSSSPRWEWNSFAHYISIFTSGETWLMFGNTIFFLVFDLILALVPPLIFAFFLTLMRHKKLSGIIRTLLFLPAIIPGVTSLIIWKEAFFATENGILNAILGLFGVRVQWLADASITRWSLLLMGFPFVGSYLIFYGAMMNIPSSYYEAAELDGITIWGRFRKIDLPLIRPQLKYVFIMTFIASIQNFSRLFIIFGKTATSYVPKTLIYEMYTLFKTTPTDYGKAAAYATIIFILLFGFTFTSFRMKRKGNEV